MLSYRHAWHAGNAADVLKHLVLREALAGIARKDKPFLYVDTHAGRGVYDLASPLALRHAEHRDGIERLREAHDLPPALAAHLAGLDAAAARAHRPPGARLYPGSPLVASACLRPGDRAVLAELHGGDAPHLAALFAGHRRVRVERTDGYALLRALLPPRERRALVLVDPSWERADEDAVLRAALTEALRRLPQAVLLVWYPLLARLPPARWQNRLIAAGLPPTLRVELALRPIDAPMGMNGAGMLIVNPPWRMDEAVAAWLPALARLLSQGGSSPPRCDWLVPERSS